MKHEEVYKDGEDNGWLKKQNFWFDENHPNGFNIVDLDSIYPEKYFEVDHVKPETIDNYCRLIPEFYEKITGKKLESIFEVGSGGGWFLKRFIDMGIEAQGIEGSTAGINACKKRGLFFHGDIWQNDIRRLEACSASDIIICTEVAEHIEPPFSALFVKALTTKTWGDQAGLGSDLIWFSFEPPNTNPAHIHHPNEMPAKFWINLFEFYGYGCYMLPDWVFDQTEGRGRMIFYNKETYGNNEFFKAH